MRSVTATRVAAWTASAVVVAVALAALVMSASDEGSLGAVGLKPLVLPLLWAVPGALIASAGPRLLGGSMIGVAALFGLSGLATAVLQRGPTPGAAWWIWYADRASALIVPLTLLTLLLLPDGRIPRRRWRAVMAVGVGVQVAIVLAWSFVRGPAAAPDTSLPEWTRSIANPAGFLPEQWQAWLGGDAEVLLSLPFLLVLGSVWSRLRSATGDTRRRMVNVLLAAVSFVLLVVIGRQVWPAGADLLDISGGAMLAVTVVATVLRMRLSRLDWLVGRMTVFLTLAVMLALGYAVVASAAEASGSSLSPLVIGVMAAAVTLALAPARAWLQGAVDWALYGDARQSAQVRRLTQELSESRQRIVTAREEERAALRGRLHDDLGPSLASLAMQLGELPSIVAEDPDLARRRLARLSDVAEQALEDVRTISRDLRPPALDELGLVAALLEVGEGQALSVSVDARDLPPLPAGVEAAAYRIGREALTNVARHAGCRAAELLIHGSADGLSLEVRDRGAGRSGSVGVGLVSMRERAAELGGWVRVEDTDGGGTRVLAWLPIAVAGGR